jgi:hypothetical protein
MNCAANWVAIASSSASLSSSGPLQSSRQSALSVIAMQDFGGGWPTAYDRAACQWAPQPQNSHVRRDGRVGERRAAAG